MIYIWKYSLTKISYYLIFLLMLLNGCKEHLPLIAPDLQVFDQTANSVVSLNKPTVPSKRIKLSQQRLVKYKYPKKKTRTKNNLPSKNLDTDSNAGGKNQLAKSIVEPKLSDKIPEKHQNQKIAQLFVPDETPKILNEPSPDIEVDRFSNPPPPPIKSNVPRVALLLPLSGPHSAMGHAFLNAAQLALFHFADKEFELIPQDTMGTPIGAADAAALAIGDGASLILGPLFSSSVTAITHAVKAAHVPVISFSNDRRVAGSNIFTMGFLPSEQVDRVVQFAYTKGLKRFALLAPDNLYGKTVSRTLNTVTQRLNAEVTNISFYDPKTLDFGPIVRNLGNYVQRRKNLLDQRKELADRDDDIAKEALKKLDNLQTLGDLPFDALMVADGGKRLQAIAALLPYYDIDPKKTRLLGTGLWDSQRLASEPALIGGWFAAPPKKERQGFITNYIEMFGSSPPRLATLAYDATALAAVFVKPDGSFDPSEITVPEGFGGRDGIFRFTPQGHANRGLSIYQVEERNIKVIQKAPSSFNIPTN